MFPVVHTRNNDFSIYTSFGNILPEYHGLYKAETAYQRYGEERYLWNISINWGYLSPYSPIWVMGWYWRSSPCVLQSNCHSPRRETWKMPFNSYKASWDFFIVIILWLLPWWTLALTFIMVNIIQLLNSSKKPFKIILWWLAAVGKFPHGVPQIHSMNDSDGKLVTGLFYSCINQEDFKITLRYINWRRLVCF